MLPPSTQTKLYGNELSAHCRAVHAFLLGANVPFQFVPVSSAEELLAHFEDLKITERPAFAPVLIDHGIILSGAPTILRYMGAKTGNMYSTDLTFRAKIDHYLEWHMSFLFKVSSVLLHLLNASHPALYCRELSHMLGSDRAPVTASQPPPVVAALPSTAGSVTAPTASTSGSKLEHTVSASALVPDAPVSASTVTWDTDEIGAAYTKYLNTLSVMESLLADSAFLAGPVMSIADVVAFAELQFAAIAGIELKDYAKLYAWYEKVRTCESLGNAWTTVSQVIEEFIEIAKKEQDEAKKKTDHMKKRGRDARGGSRPPDVFHRVLFYRPVHEVYRLFTVQEEWSKVTGKPCVIGVTPGSAFDFHDGAITGKTLYMLENIKLLQSWRLSDWPEGKFSTTKLGFSAVGEDKCEVCMEQADIPAGSFKKIDDQWQTLMWSPLSGLPLREHNVVIFFDYASPHMLYDLLMDSAKASKWMRAKCEVSRGSGARLSYLDGAITGTNIELTTDTKIVQSWRLNDWPANHYSTVTINIHRVFGGSDLSFHQTDIPGDKLRALSDLLDKHFWRRLRREIAQNY